MKINRFVAVTMVVAALQTTGAWAQVGDPNISSRDARFLQQAAQSALLQFAMAQPAMGSGPTQELRDYGLQLAADYGTPGSHFGINGGDTVFKVEPFLRTGISSRLSPKAVS